LHILFYLDVLVMGMGTLNVSCWIISYRWAVLLEVDLGALVMGLAFYLSSLYSLAFYRSIRHGKDAL
jgi:hypothetical protein